MTAAIACALTWGGLTAVLPAPLTTPRAGPVLETVTPAQLNAMGLRMEATVQPLELPGWLHDLGLRPPTTILLERDAEAVARKSSGGVRAIAEVTLTYATLAPQTPRSRAPTIVHRLVWAVVGTRTVAGAVGTLVQVLWLVDARSGRQLTELQVPVAVPPAAVAPAAGPAAVGVLGP